MSLITVHPLPALSDNYIWILRDAQHAVIVDPGDDRPVREYLEREGLQPLAILITHHHGDHTDGVRPLKSRYDLPVYGPHDARVDPCDHRLREGDKVAIAALDLHLEVIEIPGHTRSHIAYYGPGMLFCGDTLFACGCGRLFEGTPEQMHRSLAKLTALPDTTRVYCAHEYTLSNIEFARAVEPDNAALNERAAHDAATRTAGQPTLPTTIGLEKATNPFLRVQVPTVIRSATQRLGHAPTSPVETFAAIREWKNVY